MDSSAARKLPDVRSDSLGWSEWKVISENLHLTHLAYRSKLHLRVEAEAKVAIQPIKHATLQEKVVNIFQYCDKTNLPEKDLLQKSAPCLFTK